MSAASFANGATERPWNELVQSMFDGSSSCSFIGSSERPDASVTVAGGFDDEEEGRGGGRAAAAEEAVAGVGAASPLRGKETEK